jgi:curved DNA-binding protein CbpA
MLALPPSPISREKARVLLGVDAGATREAVIEAHRRLVFQIHPDRGGTNDLVHEANAARDLLLADLARSTGR